MGLIGVTRAAPSDGPIHECPEIWVTPELVECAAGWSWRLDPSLPPDGFIGHHVVYETQRAKAVWKIVALDPTRHMLLCRWPD